MAEITATRPDALEPGFFALSWSNWRLALLVAIIAIPAAIALLPPEISFWVALAAAALVALALVVRAWGRHTGGLLVAPALALLFVMNIFPLMWSFGLSFFHYRANRMAPPRFAGFSYYEKVMTDPVVWERLQTTAVLAVLSVGLQMVVGFLLAMLFAKEFPLRRYLLILVLTPMMLSFVAVGAFFRYYYEPSIGLLSQAVRVFTGEPYVLMSSTGGAMAGIVFADAWMWSPFVMLLVLAGLVSVPKYLYEAAEIDRASFWRKFTSLTFP
jgi:multiple sugar transport system permease protein